MKRTDETLVGVIGHLILGLHNKGELEDVNGNLSRVEVLDYLDQFKDDSFVTDVINHVKENSNNNDVTFVEEN